MLTQTQRAISVECLLRTGRSSEAVAVMDQIDASEAPGVGELFVRFIKAAARRAPADPDVDRYLAIADVWKDPEAHYMSAYYMAYPGEASRALSFLARAVQGGFFCYPAMVQDPWFDPLRGDPEFIKLLRLAETRHQEATAAFAEAGGERLLGM